jgi:hypothetical protein
MQTNSHLARKRDRQILLTQHAVQRMQKRSISPTELTIVRKYGTQVFDGRGAVRYEFDHRAEKRCIRAENGLINTERLRGMYVVEVASELGLEAEVITVSRRW